MARKKRTLAENAEVAAATGHSMADWAKMLQAKDPPATSFSAAVECLVKDYGLQIYWAHCIAHKLSEEQNSTQTA